MQFGHPGQVDLPSDCTSSFSFEIPCRVGKGSASDLPSTVLKQHRLRLGLRQADLKTTCPEG